MIERSKGSGIKEPSKSEQTNLQTNRASIIVMEDITAGSVINEKMVDIRRPGSGIQPIYFEKILGKKALIDIPRETPLQWNMLE